MLLLGVFIPFSDSERDSYTQKCGLLCHYFTVGIPEPHIDDVHLVHAFLLDGVIIMVHYFINN